MTSNIFVKKLSDLQKYVEDELSEALIQGELTGKNLVEVYAEDDKLKYRPIPLEETENVLTAG